MVCLRKTLAVTALSALLTFGAASVAQAQDYNTVLNVPQGATLVSLSATEQVEVEQDLLVATLMIKHEHADAKIVQDVINNKMREALEAAKKVESVKVSTQQYYVYEYDRSQGKSARTDMVWRGQQSLQLKGKTADDLLALARDLQEAGMTMSGLNYTLSPEKLEETRSGLLEDALKKLQATADRTAKAIGKSNVDMLQIDVNMGGGGYYAPVMRSMAMADSAAAPQMAAPVAAPGESRISLTVSAQALLK